MTRPFAKPVLTALIAALFSAGSLSAAPVLTNGDFEATPPSALGNNLNEPAAAAPWIMGGGQTPNVVKVDGPGGFNYGSSGPESDASAPGAGIEQHYLDIANGSNNFYQAFTPLCTGEVTYSAAFSTRDNSAGEAGIQILADADLSVIGPRQATNLAGGNSATDPWTVVTYTTALTANTAYRFLVDMDNNMNMDNAYVRFETYCPAHDDVAEVTTEKTCEAPQVQQDGTITVACDLVVSFPEGPPLDGAGNPVGVTVVDQLTLNGAPSTATVVALPGADPWACGSGPFSAFPGDDVILSDLTCSLDAAATVIAATNSTDGLSGTSVLSTLTTFPAGTTGEAANCAKSVYQNSLESAVYGLESCAEIDLPEPPVVPEQPLQCAAFTPEVTCNPVTGQPVVTLTNTYAEMFSPDSVSVTSLTSGVTALASKADPLAVQLTGAIPGQTITLWTEAVEKGAGSDPILDLCCMGEVQVTIPEGLICEPEQVLEVSKTCNTGLDPAIDTDVDCEITVHYEGPPPSQQAPISITESVTGTPWGFTTTPLSGDSWQCPVVADATPFTCTISAADEPGADWQNWTSTLIVQMQVGEEFENCATVTAEGGLQDQACWSSETPKLTVEKTADQGECRVGAPCGFTITVSNPSGTDYTGPLSMTDTITSIVPNLSGASGQFTAISPALCPVADLNNGGMCSGTASVAAGSAQSYTVTWVPSAWPAGEADSLLVTNCVGATGLGGSADPVGDGAMDGVGCATVEVLPPDITIAKTGPESCTPGQPCDYQVTISTLNQPFNGPVLLIDAAPAGFAITAITPTPPGCGANLPANPLVCVVSVSLTAGGSVAYTLTIEATDLSLLDQPLQEENCAGLRSVPGQTSPADYSFDGSMGLQLPEGLSEVIAGGSELGTSCAPVVWTVENPDTPPEVVKTCTPLVRVDGVILYYTTTCTITVTVTSPDGFGGQLTVSDVFTAPNGGTLGVFTPISGNWTCTGASCTIGPMPQGTYQLEVPITGIDLKGTETATNCAVSSAVLGGSGMTAGDEVQLPDSCVTLVPRLPNPDPAELSIIKTCEAPVSGAMGVDIACTITVTATGTVPPVIEVTELMGQNLQPSDTGGSIQTIASADPWVVQQGPHPMATPVPMTIAGTDMPSSGTSVINVTLKLMNNSYLAETENCVTLQAYDVGGQPMGDAQQSCAYFTPKSLEIPAEAPVLGVTKTSTGPCVPDVAAQTYACGFDVTISNAGAAFAGPMVLRDAFDPGMASAVAADGAGWSCSLVGDAASCINGNLSLAAGASDTLGLQVTVQGLPDGGTFENCAAIGASDDPKEQAIIVQTALKLMGIDIGVIDGVVGRRTRAAVTDLQGQLGLQPTGEIDSGLLVALGVPVASGADQSCVTVDLPVMPLPPIACQGATTRLTAGECACRFKSMYQIDKTSCGCVKGTRFVAGEGCLKVEDKPQVKDKPAVTVNPQVKACDPNTTVLRNGRCQCREEGMTRVSDTACAKAKPKAKPRICPNGLPEIPGVGCIDLKIQRNDKSNCNPALQKC